MDGSQFAVDARSIDRAAVQKSHSQWSLKHLLIAAGSVLVLAVAAVYGEYYWTSGRFLVSTDDAYVKAHSVLISPKVSGYISEVPVDDNQSVKAGEVIARIDPRDYQTALDQARANVAAAQASIDTLNQQIAQQKLVVEQDRASRFGSGGARLLSTGFSALHRPG
jgi:membrane fusion protein, multidrug efflux system